MLRKFAVTNFRSINSSVELSFVPLKKEKYEEYYLTEDNLLKLAIIYGPNASGKTNIIKALDFVRDFILIPVRNREDRIKVDNFRFTDSLDPTTKFVIEFIESNKLFEYTLHVNSQFVVYERLRTKTINKKGSKLASIFSRRSTREKTEIRWGRIENIPTEMKKLLKIATLQNMSVFSGYLRLNAKVSSLDAAITFFKKLLPPIYPITSNEALLRYVAEKVRENQLSEKEILKILSYADFAINNFEIKEKTEEVDDKIYKLVSTVIAELEEGEALELSKEYKEIEVWFEHFNKYKLEFKDESAGTRRFFLLAAILILVIKKSLIIPIDEIESSMHPDLVKFFILFFLKNSKNSQMLFTTHMRELLLEKNILRKDIIWFCEKENDGSTDLFSLKDFGSEIREESSIYNFYKYGKLGAIPNIRTSLRL